MLLHPQHPAAEGSYQDPDPRLNPNLNNNNRNNNPTTDMVTVEWRGAAAHLPPGTSQCSQLLLILSPLAGAARLHTHVNFYLPGWGKQWQQHKIQ